MTFESVWNFICDRKYKIGAKVWYVCCRYFSKTDQEEIVMAVSLLKQPPPVVALTPDKKVRLKVQKEYYESKIKCLMDMNLPMKLILLACWDSPVERHDLTSKRGQKRFVKQCLKYYKKKLKEIEKAERRLG